MNVFSCRGASYGHYFRVELCIPEIEPVCCAKFEVFPDVSLLPAVPCGYVVLQAADRCERGSAAYLLIKSTSTNNVYICTPPQSR